MAADSVDSLLIPGNQCLLESVISDTSCPYCSDLKERLDIVTQELLTARTIITLLKEDGNSTSDLPTLDSGQHHQMSANIQSTMDKIWTTVTYKSNKNKVDYK